MTSEEKEVLGAVLRFYDAIEQMIGGKGLAAMIDAWHHTPDVSSGHPTGDWAHGWDEVLATWGVFASFGKEGNGGTKVRDVKVHVYGDFAYATGVFVAAPTLGSATMSVTNVLWRAGGAWKIVHHHADKAPSVQASLEKMAEEG
jgi:ketosteroid isomerase-like protein